ncbi:MAG TPA: pectate lyase [Flavisolibacter sp.]|jgi:pectinesterase|nr:pectate lyase [Flavisolibacter sp.]
MTKPLTRFLLLIVSCLLTAAAWSQDAVADNMLLYQRSIGGWPKHFNNVNVDYNKPLSESDLVRLTSDRSRKDATIDNGATTKEIRYLVKAYQKSGNKTYLQAAEKGIRYLLQMQMANGGFPQFYPDSSSYRGQITYNDNAMINALNVLWDVAYGSAGLDVVDASLREPAKVAVAKGIDCILKTQVVINGKPTVWGAQHDKKTLLPVNARAFELASLSGSESVGILNFLMKVENPSPAVKSAVVHAVEWLKAARVRGYKYQDVEDPSQPKGRDRVLVKDDFSSVWARFYDLETGKPMFAGRDGKKRFSLSEVEVERRTGYAWYGTWPEKLLQKTYPAWQLKNGLVTAKTTLVVSQDGKGDYTSIQAAIDHLPDSSATPRTIRIKPGTYNEKIFIAKHNIIFEGEDRETTKIVQSIARDEWRCDHVSDWGVATVNIDGDDITLKNLTVVNDYGFTQTAPRTVACSHDSTGKRQITRNSHQMALRSMNATRLKAINCRFRAYAGDTVSPWNLADGMFYFKDCIMEGGVDFYCPRGWAYAENCTFYAHSGPAAIWHDGSTNPDYKTVLKNCTFDGYKGFKLGRYHKDAQFYLVDCTFSQNMADEDIYLVPTTNVLQWGRRIYYANCRREGGDYSWFADNLHRAQGSPKAEQVNAAWVFGRKWQPEKIL